MAVPSAGMFDISSDGRIIAYCKIKPPQRQSTRKQKRKAEYSVNVYSLAEKKHLSQFTINHGCSFSRLHPTSKTILIWDVESTTGKNNKIFFTRYSFTLYDWSGNVVNTVDIKNDYLIGPDIDWISPDLFIVDMISDFPVFVKPLDYIISDSAIVNIRTGEIQKASDIVKSRAKRH